MIDKNTKVCISIAAKPGKFGVAFHNKGYQFLGLNFAYIPLKVEENQLSAVIDTIRENFHGCSVSMPHKINVLAYLDKVDDSAAKIGAVNTILNEKGRLIGYNTDYYGAKKAIISAMDITGKDVVMFGAGGVARAIGWAVKDLGGNLLISNRTAEKGKSLSDRLGGSYIPPEKMGESRGHLFINATSLGMAGEALPIEENRLAGFLAVMDVVAADTKLLRDAKSRGQICIPGRRITLYQAAEQFRIYTGMDLPNEFLEKFL